MRGRRRTEPPHQDPCRAIYCVTEADRSIDDLYCYLESKLGNAERVGRYAFFVFLALRDWPSDYRVVRDAIL